MESPVVSPLYDVHFHPQLDLQGLEATLEHPALAIANGTGPEDWKAVAEICRQKDWIKPAFGLHPRSAANISPDWKESLQRFLDGPGVAGIGEIGLDRTLPEKTYNIQREVFEWQWQLAHERGLPVIVHCVKAWGMLKDSLRQLPHLERGFLMHGYSGSAEMVDEFAAMGAWFSFSATVRNPNRKKQQQALRKVSIDRLLVESDGAVSAQYQDELEKTYRFLAGQRDFSESEFITMVAENVQKFFRGNWEAN